MNYSWKRQVFFTARLTFSFLLRLEDMKCLSGCCRSLQVTLKSFIHFWCLWWQWHKVFRLPALSNLSWLLCSFGSIFYLTRRCLAHRKLHWTVFSGRNTGQSSHQAAEIPTDCFPSSRPAPAERTREAVGSKQFGLPCMEGEAAAAPSAAEIGALWGFLEFFRLLVVFPSSHFFSHERVHQLFCPGRLEMARGQKRCGAHAAGGGNAASPKKRVVCLSPSADAFISLDFVSLQPIRGWIFSVSFELAVGCVNFPHLQENARWRDICWWVIGSLMTVWVVLGLGAVQVPLLQFLTLILPSFISFFSLIK